MGFHGYYELLTEDGFYGQTDTEYTLGILMNININVEVMGELRRAKYKRLVDITNGYGDDRYSVTSSEEFEKNIAYGDENARKEIIETLDWWHTDHYGNKYATKVYRYKIFMEDGWQLI